MIISCSPTHPSHSPGFHLSLLIFISPLLKPFQLSLMWQTSIFVLCQVLYPVFCCDVGLCLHCPDLSLIFKKKGVINSMADIGKYIILQHMHAV